jgi:hypothetical protein
MNGITASTYLVDAANLAALDDGTPTAVAQPRTVDMVEEMALAHNRRTAQLI